MPPTALRFAVYVLRSNKPVVTDKFPLIVILLFNEAMPLDLFITRLLNVVASIVCALVPFKVTVEEPAVNVPPPFTQFPPKLIP